MTKPKPPHNLEIAELSDQEFHRLSDLVYQRSGIQLFQHKRTLVRNRLSRRLRALGLDNFEAYLNVLSARDGKGTEFDSMLESICTHVTGFFREPAHFDYLAKSFAPRHKASRTVRILSAGCSTGEEPYSIAMRLRDAFGPESRVKIEVLAVDLSASILKVAATGIYDEERVRLLPRELLHRHFLKGQKRYPNKVRICPEVRQMVTFRQMNLIRPSAFTPPFEGPFDAIFCRNVIIYFDRQSQLDCFRWFHERLAPGGVLFLGHSESLIGSDHCFNYVQPTVYQKQFEPGAARERAVRNREEGASRNA